MPMAPAPEDLAGLSLADIARLAEEEKLPPVEKWNPEHCGDSAMRIARDGTWYHEGAPIGRPAMVRLFSTILRREPDGRHVLVTPVEKLDIEVEDAAFVAVELKSEGDGQARRTPEILPGDAFDEEVSDRTPAAVLVAVVDRAEPTVIFTERPKTMRKHPGQVSFPGGRIDPGDSGPVEAALREAEEEIGLAR